MRLAFAFLAVLLLAASARAESGTDRVKVDVMADTSAVAAGKPFDVAVHFHIDAGWHIYWTNPGDSGLATEVKLMLPAGFAAGPVRYPVPAVLPQPGGLVNYGYENDATLVVTVTPPAALAAGPVRVGVDASWLVCQERCLPGRATVAVELPVGSPGPAHAEAFNAARAQLVRSGDPAHVSSVRITTRSADACDVVVQWSRRPTDVRWVPGPDLTDSAMATDRDTTRVHLAGPPTAGGVLTYAVDGQRIGLALTPNKTPATGPAAP